MTILFWLFILLGVVGFFKSQSLSNRLDKLEKMIEQQSALLRLLEKNKSPESQTASSEVEETLPDAPITQPTKKAPTSTMMTSELITTQELENQRSREKAIFERGEWHSLATAPAIPEWANTYINWLKENWPGFIGVSILVLGIIFGVFYLGFFATPLIRFLMVLGLGAMFAVASFLLSKSAVWQELSGWLLAGSGAVILFAMIASSQLPALMFYHDPFIGLCLLLAGLFINIIFAYLSSKQTLATFYVIINLLALILAPKENIIMITATVVTLSGIALSFRKAWNTNLLITMLGFLLFHYFWFIAQNSAAIAFIGIGCTVIVGISALLIHYRKIYNETDKETNIFTHVSVWILLGIQLFWYNLGFKYIAIPLGLTSLIVFTLSLYAKRKGMLWLHLTDAVIGQILALLTIISLTRIQVDDQIISWLATIESLCFTSICYFRRQMLLSKIGMGLTTVSLIVFFLMLLQGYFNLEKTVIMSIATIIPFYGMRWFVALKESKQFQQTEDISFSVLLDVAWLLFGSALLWNFMWGYQYGYPIFMLFMILITFNKVLIQEKIHQLCFVALLLQTLVFSWCKLNEENALLMTVVLYVLPPLLLMLATLKAKIFQFEREKINHEDIWVYLLGVNLFLTCWILFWPISYFIPGISLLALGILFFETSAFINEKILNERNYLIASASRNTAIFNLLIFAGFYTLLYIQSEATVFAVLSMREVLTIVAILSSFYWYLTKPMKNQFSQYSNHASIKLLNFTQEITFDIGLFFAIAYVIVEYSAPIHPIGYGLVALLFCIPYLRPWLPPRSLVYSICLLYAACIQVAIVSSSWASPLSNWYQTTHITGPISMIIALIVAFLLLKQIYHRNENLALKLYAQNAVMFGFLPIFTALALFLFWRFDKGYLTMLWVIEILFIVIFGFLLKNKNLVRIAFGFLAFCVLRLVFYDLAQTDLLIRALVFVTVGLLMIFIHMIYKKYVGRLA